MRAVDPNHERFLDDKLLPEIIQLLTRAYRPERIYQFGSTARGDSDSDSDLDLLVVVPDDAPAERRRARLAYDVLWDIPVAVDVVIWTKTAFDRRATVPASLPATVLREGKLVHAA